MFSVQMQYHIGKGVVCYVKIVLVTVIMIVIVVVPTIYSKSSYDPWDVLFGKTASFRTLRKSDMFLVTTWSLFSPLAFIKVLFVDATM